MKIKIKYWNWRLENLVLAGIEQKIVISQL